MTYNFGMIGIAGYIAPRHLQAIKDTGNQLIVAYDQTDSVGYLDRFNRKAAFFKTLEEFYYYIKTSNARPDYISISSPNYLHAPHIMISMDLGAHVICEKPLVLSTRDLEILGKHEELTGKRLFTVLQLREHQMIKEVKAKYEGSKTVHDIDLCYITSRGPWYHQTWKADPRKSGDLSFNIGIHFFDMLMWIFGNVVRSEMHISTETIKAGYIELERARVRWFLSIDENQLPSYVREKGQTTFRSLTIDGAELEFSDGFTDLHTAVYRSILNGQGYGLEAALPAIQAVEHLNTLNPLGVRPDSHSMLKSL